ncbi:MAG TPA: hypothetical protein VL995_20500 [Cellvibrio sp.]|nr:hypothetical protein [Cellvibrio sp.]
MLNNFDEYLSYLELLGASEYNHISGPMINHLTGTYNILSSWGAPLLTCKAGLFHAIYGPQGLPSPLISLEKRLDIKNFIGHDVEELVYFYCACDKSFVLPQFKATSEIIFKDRFTGEEKQFDKNLMTSFCELTVANEIDVARGTRVEVYSDAILDMLKSMYTHINKNAQRELDSIFKIAADVNSFCPLPLS